jgi:hypothetical protein
MTYSDALWGNASCDVGVKSPSVTGSHLWRMKYLRYSKKKSFVKFQTSNVYLKKKRSADKKLKNNKKTNFPKFTDIQWNKRRNKVGTIRADVGE